MGNMYRNEHFHGKTMLPENLFIIKFGNFYGFQSWRFGEVAAIRSPFMNLLTKAEKSLVFADPNIWICCDAMLVATFLNPSTIVASKEMHVTVELFGIKTRGQVVIDHLGEEEPNVTMVTKVDEELFKEMVIDAAKVMQTR